MPSRIATLVQFIYITFNSLSRRAVADRTKAPEIVRHALFLVGLVAIGAAAGAAASALRMPLAWMIGPLLVSAAIYLLRPQPAPPRAFRFLGQAIVGSAVGLYLTPDALQRVLENGWLVISGALLINVAACSVGLAQAWLGRLDPATALFSNVPGGPAEMAALAEANGGSAPKVAIAQTLRVVLIVLIFPPLLVSASTFPVQPTGFGSWLDSGILVSAALAAGLLARVLRVPSPFFLGPMTVIGLWTASGALVPQHHQGVVPAAQILLGLSLGAMFRRDLFAGNRYFLAGLALSTLALLALCALVAFVLSHLFDVDLPTLLLSTAPGAVPEMVLTAKVLHFDVPLVASVQFVRIMVGLVAAAALYRLMARPLGRIAARKDDP